MVRFFESKKVKKVIATALVATMLSSISVTGFAAEAKDVATESVNETTVNDEVQASQITEPQPQPVQENSGLPNQQLSGMTLDGSHKVNLTNFGKGLGDIATRGDAAVLIYNQIRNKSDKRAYFSDITSGTNVGNAVGLLGAFGYYPVKAGNYAEPNKNITRAELAFMLAPFFSPGIEPSNYVDVPAGSAYYPYIAKATEYGWIDGFADKTFRPEAPMTVGEVGTAINKAIGFSGDDEIDAYVANVLATITNDSMDRETKLHVCYNWTRDSFTYLKRNYYQIGDRGWNQQEGKVMFQTQRGNCYCFTSVFYYLARRLGYNARSISGVVGHKRSPHGWVEIEENGITYIYDTELEMAYLKKGKVYDFYHMPYNAVPWPYVKR